MAVDHTRGEPAWLLGSEAGRRGEKGVYRVEGWECWEPQRAGPGAVVKATSRSSGEISNSEAGQLLRHQPQYQLLLPTCLVPTSAGAGAARWVGEGAAAGRVDAPQPPIPALGHTHTSRPTFFLDRPREAHLKGPELLCAGE